MIQLRPKRGFGRSHPHRFIDRSNQDVWKMNKKQVSLALIAGSYVILSTGCESMSVAKMESAPGPKHATEGPYSEFVWEALGATPSIRFASEQRASTRVRASNAQATAAAK